MIVITATVYLVIGLIIIVLFEFLVWNKSIERRLNPKQQFKRAQLVSTEKIIHAVGMKKLLPEEATKIIMGEVECPKDYLK